MIDQERVREMTKLAAFEEHEGKKYQQVKRYFRSDFAVRHLIKGFFSAAVVFGLLLLMWGICHLEELISGLGSMDLVQFGIDIIVRYIIFAAVYLTAIEIYANVFYAAGRRSLKRYYRRLKRLSRLYEEQERRTAPDSALGGENDDFIGI